MTRRPFSASTQHYYTFLVYSDAGNSTVVRVTGAKLVFAEFDSGKNVSLFFAGAAPIDGGAWFFTRFGSRIFYQRCQVGF